VNKKTTSLTRLPEWRAPETHFSQIEQLHLRTLFAEDPARGDELACEAAGLYLDYSKNRVTRKTLQLLLKLADSAALTERISG
jgi:glucose-6-phosphate isomerase